MKKHKLFIIIIFPVLILGITSILLRIYKVPDKSLAIASQHFVASDSVLAKKNTIDRFITEELAHGKKPNRLIHEKSPYLLQHAFNPVNWYPWGEEAFSVARRDNKPIFLSIGYSTCHWCHVMEKESFENPAIAAIMNKYFVSIKVDREERPDVDRVYMSSVLALRKSGGWPLSTFLTPDLKMFFGATYFPPDQFTKLLESINQAWQTDHDKILESAEAIYQFLNEKTSSDVKTTGIKEGILDEGFRRIQINYDARFGGFGKAPKFPRPVTLNYLMRYHFHSGNEHALDMTLKTLRSIAKGGIHDHIGGGFHRYSVDGQWRIPHFEKMLYNQSQLTMVYLDAYLISKDRFYAEIANDILQYVQRDMMGGDGNFYSAEDADSPLPDDPHENSEGAFYIWSENEIVNVLGDEAGEIFSYRFGVKGSGNALSDPRGEFTGMNILFIDHTIDETAAHFGKSTDAVESVLNDARKRLFRIREGRKRPHLDDKTITAWNGLMISAFARGYQVLQNERYLQTAEKAAIFITKTLYDSERGILHRRYRDGHAGLEAHLRDYSFFIQGLLDLYESSFKIDWLNFAVSLMEKQIDIYWDHKNGGFFDTSGNDKSVLVRMKEDYDGSEPTGNSTGALNLLRLSEMTDNKDWRDKALQTISSFSQKLNQYPPIMPQMLAAYQYYKARKKQIIISGDPLSKDTHVMLQEIYQSYLPNKIILLADGGEGQAQLMKYLPVMKYYSMVDGKTTAYICENYICQLPTTDLKRLRSMLNHN